MPTFKDVKSLLKYAQQQTQSVLKTDIAKKTVSAMQQKIQEEVYDKYEPVQYERKGYHGGLIDEDNIEVSMVDDNTLCVENIRFDGKREVAQIVESGDGYQYDFDFNGVPRPFTEATRKELASGVLHQTMKTGLSRKGFDVR